MRVKGITRAVFLVLLIVSESVYGGDEGTYNTFYGTGAGASLSSSATTYATFIGADAGNSNTTSGLYNTFVGYQAGYLNTDTDYNAFLGYKAGYNNTASYNTILGGLAGYNNTTGLYNTFVGYMAGNANTGSDHNTFVGYRAGYNSTTTYSTFLGSEAGLLNTDGQYNTYVGSQAGRANISGDGNTFMGFWAGYNNTASNNLFVGASAGYNNTTGTNNTFVGYMAGYQNQLGDANTFLGYLAGNKNTGSWNTFVGYRAGYNNTASYNTLLGYNAGYNNTSGGYNTFLGYQAGHNNTAGQGNVFIGYGAGYYETGKDKLYIDSYANDTPLIYGEFGPNGKLKINGNLEVIGPDNGLVRLSNVTTDNTTKVSRMVLNHYSNAQPPVYLFGAASTASDNFVAFGGGNPVSVPAVAATQIDLFTAPNTTTPTGTSRITIKNNGYVGIGTQTPSYPLHMAGGAYSNGTSWIDGSSREYKNNIKDLKTEDAVETLKGLHPVTFNYKTSPDEGHVGFIAEEVPALVATKDRKGLSSMDIVAVLTKVVQDLRAENEAMKQRLMQLEERITASK